jgi:hypothetical protein
MSSSGERGLGRSRLPLKKKCPYRGNLNKTLEQLNQARAHLQVGEQNIGSALRTMYAGMHCTTGTMDLRLTPVKAFS